MMTSEQMWETYSTPLHRFLRRRLPEPESADDVLQEVFVRVHTRIDTLDDPTCSAPCN